MPKAIRSAGVAYRRSSVPSEIAYAGIEREIYAAHVRGGGVLTETEKQKLRGKIKAYRKSYPEESIGVRAYLEAMESYLDNDNGAKFRAIRILRLPQERDDGPGWA